MDHSLKVTLTTTKPGRHGVVLDQRVQLPSIAFDGDAVNLALTGRYIYGLLPAAGGNPLALKLLTALADALHNDFEVV